MSDISFRCPHCSQPFEAPAELAGQQTRCENCGKAFSIPSPERPAKDAPQTPHVYPDFRVPPGEKRKGGRSAWVLAWRIIGSICLLNAINALMYMPAATGTGANSVGAVVGRTVAGLVWEVRLFCYGSAACVSFWLAFVTDALSTIRSRPSGHSGSSQG